MNEIIQGLMKFLKSYTNMKMQYILQGLVLSSYNGIFFHKSMCIYNLASQQNYALPYFELRIKIETA